MGTTPPTLREMVKATPGRKTEARGPMSRGAKRIDDMMGFRPNPLDTP